MLIKCLAYWMLINGNIFKYHYPDYFCLHYSNSDWPQWNCSVPGMCWTFHIHYIIDSKSFSFIFPVTLVLVFNVLVIFPFCRKMGLTIRLIFHHQICDLLSFSHLVSKDSTFSADPLPVEAMLIFAVQLQRAFCPPPLWYFFIDCIFSGT